MKIVASGTTYQIYDNGIKTFDALPAQAYSINFSSQTGFSLSEYGEIKINEKTYGVHNDKVRKMINSFERSERSLGVILSGAKGIGKSLFGKILSIEGIKRGFPLIIVDQYLPGIANFINSIDQEVYVLFDEFDKTFCGQESKQDSYEDPQTEMLTLFDGVSQGKDFIIILDLTILQEMK